MSTPPLDLLECIIHSSCKEPEEGTGEVQRLDGLYRQIKETFFGHYLWTDNRNGSRRQGKNPGKARRDPRKKCQYRPPDT